MAFQIHFSESSLEDMKVFSKRERVAIFDKTEMELTHTPNVQHRNRKELDANPLAHWELRIGEFRVFYEVDVADLSVRVVAIGRKIHNQLFVRGVEVQI